MSNDVELRYGVEPDDVFSTRDNGFRRFKPKSWKVVALSLKATTKCNLNIVRDFILTTDILLTSFSGLAFVFYGLSLLFLSNMQAEFERFGLQKFRRLTGVLEVGGGLGLLLGLLNSYVLLVSSLGIALLMMLGLAVRIRVKDGLVLALPSLLFMLLNAYLFTKSLQEVFF